MDGKLLVLHLLLHLSFAKRLGQLGCEPRKKAALRRVFRVETPHDNAEDDSTITDELLPVEVKIPDPKMLKTGVACITAIAATAASSFALTCSLVHLPCTFVLHM